MFYYGHILSVTSTYFLDIFLQYRSLKMAVTQKKRPILCKVLRKVSLLILLSHDSTLFTEHKIFNDDKNTNYVSYYQTSYDSQEISCNLDILCKIVHPSPKKMRQAVKLPVWIPQVPGSNLSQKTDHPPDYSCISSATPDKFSLKPRTLRSTFYTTDYSLPCK